MSPMASTLTLALSKGRLLAASIARLQRAGFAPPAADSRRLVVEAAALRYLFVKDADVPVYVEQGVADCGVCGDDVLVEKPADVLAPVDLGFGRCRMSVAARSGVTMESLAHAPVVRIATKYPSVAARFAEDAGLAAEIVTLSGSVEIAPALGLADCILDMVETGATLRENGLVVVRELFETSARLVVNRASDHLKREAVADLLRRLA